MPAGNDRPRGNRAEAALRCSWRYSFDRYGKLLAQGTMHDVVANSCLIINVVTGDGSNGLAEELRGRDGIAVVAPFG
jgi:ABC-2 type transport system ATP-binding protein